MGKALLVVTLLALVGCAESGISYPDRQPPPGLLADPQAQRAGGALFHDKCASCHGHVAEGRSPRSNSFVPPPMDFSEPRYATVDPAYLYWRIETGKTLEPFRSRGSVMPAWGPYLEEQQIWQLVAYLKTRSSAD